MKDVLLEVLDMTKQLAKILNEEITSSNREKVIEELHALIEKRGQVMNKAKPPFSEEETKLAGEIFVMNQQIEVEMEKLFTGLKKEMRQMQQQKKSKNHYTNPYKDLQVVDGTFMDSKK